MKYSNDNNSDIGSFKTAYNNIKPYKPQINTGKVDTKKIMETKQFITSNDLDSISKISNRAFLGSNFKNTKFNPEKDQFGRIL